jgi:hypothetical protein
MVHRSCLRFARLPAQQRRARAVPDISWFPASTLSRPSTVVDGGAIVLARRALPGFRIVASLPLASSPEHRLPHIQFLFIGSRLCSALLSGLASRLGPCASLSRHLHLIVKRTCTSKLSIMLCTPNKRRTQNASAWWVRNCCEPLKGDSSPCRAFPDSAGDTPRRDRTCRLE